MGRHFTHRAALYLVLVAGIGGGVQSAQAAPTNCSLGEKRSLSHVRPVDATMAAALESGMRRSPIFSALVARIEALAGLVYLEGRPVRGPQGGSLLYGSMSHAVTVAGAYRIIRIAVRPRRADLMIATIAHELTHAIEVLESDDALDSNSVGILYQGIGFKVRSGVYETYAADLAGRLTLRELSRCGS
jgi:hypothetical protein